MIYLLVAPGSDVLTRVVGAIGLVAFGGAAVQAVVGRVEVHDGVITHRWLKRIRSVQLDRITGLWWRRGRLGEIRLAMVDDAGGRVWVNLQFWRQAKDLEGVVGLAIRGSEHDFLLRPRVRARLEAAAARMG
jgi:hypothetical protein